MNKKPTQRLTIRNSTAEFLIFTRQVGEDGIEVRYQDETIWLTQKLMAELFDVRVPTINEHLKNIFESNKLQADSVIRKFRITAADDEDYFERLIEWRQSRDHFVGVDKMVNTGFGKNNDEQRDDH